jgi:hypothetical protein
MDDSPEKEESDNTPSRPAPKERRYFSDREPGIPAGERSELGDPVAQVDRAEQVERTEQGDAVEQGSPRLPFNDYKHPPTRPEIDQLLGVVPSSQLRRFEHQLELMEPRTNWAMHWYENETGWGYRASYKSRVLCVLHFYRGFFTVTFSIPVDQEEQYLALRELTPGLRKAFEHFTLSTKMKWFSFHLRAAKDVDAVLAMLRLKYEDLKRKTERR